jgi:uracil-DNA glycosylase
LRARALSSPRLETRQPLRLFARDIDPVDARAARAFPEECDESLDRVALTLEHRLHAPIRLIVHPPRYSLGERASAGRLAEEDALDPTLDDDAAALHAHYANWVTMSFVERLAAARIGETFNQYAGSSLRRRRLGAYLAARSDAHLLLVAEAPGYRGTRVSGIPLTSERQLTGAGPAEATATIVHAVLAELGIASDVLLWNVVPTHPGTACSNRAPTRQEIEASAPFLAELSQGRRVIGVGRVAHGCLGGPYVRHPAHGGAAAFRAGLTQALG